MTGRRRQAFELVIFDCDGVLVDSEALENQLLVDMASTCGCPIDADAAHVEFVGRQLADCVRLIEQWAGRLLPATFIEDYRAELHGVIETNLQPVPGIHDALKAIDTLKCVASNGPRNKIEHALRVTNLDEYFGDRLFSAYDISAWKPSPMLFLHAARTMNVDPAACVVIEDSAPGIEAAQAADMHVIGYAPRGDGRRDIATIQCMQELAPMLAQGKRPGALNR